MPEVKWIKITTDMFDDEKIKLLEAMPDADTLLVIWVKLICQAGKVNSNGYIFLSENLPYTEEQFSTIFNRPVNTVKLALRAFHQLKMIDINEDGTILLPNFSKHQNLEGLNKIREQTRLRVAKHRQLVSNTKVTESNVTVTIQNKNKKENKKENKIIPDFIDESLWDDYIKSRKKPTEQAVVLLIKKLGELRDVGDDPNEVLRRSIMNGWTGIFPLDKKGGRDGTYKRDSTKLPQKYTKPPPDPALDALVEAARKRGEFSQG